MNIKSSQRFNCFHRMVLYGLGLLSLVFMHTSSIAHDSNTSIQPETVWVTVFVHGIMSIKPHLSTNNFILFLQDKVKDTYYEKSIAYMRDNDFFCKNQAMGPLGLHFIDQHDTSSKDAQKNTSSVALANLFDQMNELAGTNQKSNRYYTFGWSGLLSPRARYEDGVKLFEALDKEMQRLKDLNFAPKVRVIGYSHGGNVALNLGAAHQREFPDSSLVIDELIVLGTPIQHDTDYLINDPIFKRIYSIYSLSDRVQKLDFFSLDRFFSGRLFAARKDFTLPDKLTQIQFKVMRTMIADCPCKRYSLQDRIAQTTDLSMRGIVTGKSRLLRDVSPGHAELWAFGWTPQHYRHTYPLYPLPTISLLPFITHNIDHDDHLQNGKNKRCNKQLRKHHLIVDIRPEHEYILFRKRNKKKVEKVVPFISRQQLTAIKNAIVCVAPENYTTVEYEKHTQEAIKESHKVYKQLYAPKGKKRFTSCCGLKKRKYKDDC
ncbi:MAG: hypothetical protein NT124_02930 [Candidatus Dependentiae bacterium]|nr:hypothetical protein [Candidatus Dependentiae bacterium]